MKINFTLGLDLGTNSIGWALIEQNKNGDPLGLIACGTRIFQEAVDAKTRTPKNQTRREARSARKTIARRKMRRQNLLNILIKNKLLPSDAQEREKLFADELFDPYKLRSKALDAKLQPYELGRILYHLSKRRGFQSNRKAGKEDNNKISGAISELKEELESSKSRTLGEYLAKQSKKRDRYTDRSMYEQEFELIWQKQQPHNPKLLTTRLNIAIHNAIFFQRPLKIQKYLVGKCTFEPSRKRASKGLLEFQRFRVWQDLNNLSIKNPITREYRLLEQDEKNKLFNLLDKQKSLSWGKARKVLNLHVGEIFNLEDAKRKALIGNCTAYTMQTILNQKWDELTEEKQNSLITDMLTIDNEQGFLTRATKHWNFDDESAEKLSKTELEPGYANLSHKAICKILPFLEKGLMYDKACLEAGYNHSNQTKQDSADVLGEPPYLRNPIVQKALHEIRKVVNAIARRYGKPAVVRIEMARDMKLTKKQRQEVEKNQRKLQQQNDLAKEKLQNDFGIQNPSREDIQKYNLWQECKMVCPYTGKTISAEKLFSPDIDIEHIIPYSRSLDDSYMNKTLCMASENRSIKKNKTPYEAYHANEDKYQAIHQRIKDLPFPKRRKFEQKEVNIEEFVERQLNDTRYICAEVKNYLQQLGAKVEVSKGMATAALRHQWGLNSILAVDGDSAKNRNDHRHHAIDAIVIALTSRSLFQKLSKLSQQFGKSLSQRGFKLGNPWPPFYKDVSQKIQGIIVSHSPSRKISGALHEETAYGYSKHEKCFAYRKPLASLNSKKQVGKIRDLKIRKLVENRLKEFDGDFKKAFAGESNALLHVDGKTPIKSVRLVENFDLASTHPVKNKDGIPFKYFKYGNNHHVEIIENKEGKRQGIFVTSMQAAKRVRADKKSLVNRNHGPEWKFVMSLCNNDLVKIKDNGQEKYYRVQKMSGPTQTITLRHHTSASTKDTDQKPEVLRLTPNTLKAEKITVDCVGVISPCND